jgi:DNA repair exonuclease SbcCD ATPase subunit
MEIQELRNLYLNKIIKHINKVNNELTIYNQSNVQSGGSSLASLNYDLDRPQLKFTQHNKSAVNSLLILKTKIEELKMNEQRLEELNGKLRKLNGSNDETLQLSLGEKARMKQEIEELKKNINKIEDENSRIKAENSRMIEEHTRSNGILQTGNQAILAEVKELNDSIERISKESIVSLYSRNKELIQFYYESSIDVRAKTLELIEEIRQLGKQPNIPDIPDIRDLEQIYKQFIQESYDAASTTETEYDINSFNDKLSKLKVLLDTKISQAKGTNDKLHAEYNKYLDEKDRILAELTQSFI